MTLGCSVEVQASGGAAFQSDKRSVATLAGRKTMGEFPGPVAYLLLSWGVITALLVILVIYRTTLSTREDDQMFLNQAQDRMMASEQRVLIGRMAKLSRPIIALAVLSGALLLATTGMWLWAGLKSF